MASSTRERATSPQGPRLRTEIFDARMRARGFPTVESQASMLDLPRSTLFRIRGGQVVPNLATAFRLADAAGAKVDDLFTWGGPAPRPRKEAA